MKCPVCESDKIEFQETFRNNHPCFSDLNRVACIACGLHFAHPMPSLKRLNDYNSSYHDSAHGGSYRDLNQQAFFIGLAKTRLDFITLMEEALGKKAKKELVEMQAGDVSKTWADISQLNDVTGYTPKVNLKKGIVEFINWYLSYKKNTV